MKRTTLLRTILGGSLVGVLHAAAPAHAQATRTWVSGTGSDANPCSRSAPCQTFAGAISKTFIGGEINCLDPGGFGTVTITKSITIDCHWTHGSILASGTTGVNVNIAVNANDPLRTVRLRGLSINGAGVSGTIGTRTGLRGINATQYSALFLDDMLITQFTQQGVNVTNSVANAKTIIRNSIIRDNAAAGILSAGAATHSMVIEGVQSTGNQFGLATATGNNVMVSRSVMSGNSTAGVQADAGAQVNVDDTVISHNAVNGVQALGTIRLSNNNISFNTNGISGATTSFGNNRISGNAGAGTAPTPAGGDTQDKGQQ